MAPLPFIILHVQHTVDQLSTTQVLLEGQAVTVETIEFICTALVS